MITSRPQFTSPLQVVTLATAVLILLPLAYVTSQALSADSAVWNRLWTTRIPELLTNTIRLSASGMRSWLRFMRVAPPSIARPTALG